MSERKAKELVEVMVEVAGLEPDGIYEAPEWGDDSIPF